ncbi:MAG: ASCH domain-containing protein [Bacilli bacterium]
MEHTSISMMWTNYLATLEAHELENKTYTAWHFCSDEKSANELAALVKAGMKTATASLSLFYELEGEQLPKNGDLNVITNWDGVAQAVIEVVRVDLVPFKNVDEDFAKKEGEGDRSLTYWREVHTEFFTKELLTFNQQFSEDMLTVCVDFKLVYK